MKEYEIWNEGFEVPEESMKAYFHGIALGSNFKDACKNFSAKSKKFAQFFDPETMTYCGCKLFGNEIDARKRFG